MDSHASSNPLADSQILVQGHIGRGFATASFGGAPLQHTMRVVRPRHRANQPALIPRTRGRKPSSSASTTASANRARRMVIVGVGVGPGPPYNEVERTRRAGEDLYCGVGVVDQLAIDGEQQIACQTKITWGPKLVNMRVT